MSLQRQWKLLLCFGAVLASVTTWDGGNALAAQVPLSSTALPQFVDPLPQLPIVDGTTPLTLTMCEFQSNVMPTGFVPAAGPYTGTWTWGYVVGNRCPTTTQASYLGPIIVAKRGTPTEITFVNNLGTTATSKVLSYVTSTDQTLHWADPLDDMCNDNVVAGLPLSGVCAQNYNGAIPAAAHLHGGEVPPVTDGGPDAWFTSDGAKGHGYYSKPGAPANGATYRYPNSQEAAPIWFHDHTLGATRLNVYAGLAGAYLLTDPNLNLPANLTPLTETIPIVLQDRMFDTSGQLFFPAIGINPEHPFWVPEFIGDTVVVNGKVWPYQSVEPRRYRFIFLNGSNARTYTMSFQAQGKGTPPIFYQIGTDGGYLDTPAPMASLTIMPGERQDVIIDFAGLAPGTSLILQNKAKAPFPGGSPPQGSTVGRIMQFRVAPCASNKNGANDTSFNPASSGATIRSAGQQIVRLVNPATGALNTTPVKTRELTLNEVLAPRNKVGGVQFPGGPLEILVNNTKYNGTQGNTVRTDFTPVTIGGITTYYSEIMNEGDTEVWEFVNTTADAHPMHLHLVQFQLLNRQSYDVKNFMAAYNAAFPGGAFIPGFGPPLNYATGNARALGGNPDVTPFLMGAPLLPALNEAGWKDTIMVPPGTVTRIAVRFAPTDTPLANKAGSFPFDPNALDHGYVWHCHIIDHEDNEMMRPDIVRGISDAIRAYVQGVDY